MYSLRKNLPVPSIFDLIEFSHKLMPKSHPVTTRYKNTIRKERTYGVLPTQRENGNGTKQYSEKATSPNKQEEKRSTRGYRGACISKDD